MIFQKLTILTYSSGRSFSALSPCSAKKIVYG